MAARDSQAASPWQLAFAILPVGSLDHFIYTLGQTVALHPQSIHGDAWRLQQIAASNLGGIEIYPRGKFVELRFEGKAHVDGAMSAHSSASRLVGENAVTVVLNVWNVVERTQQGTGIKNGHNAVGAVGATILNDLRFHRSDAAIVLDAGL